MCSIPGPPPPGSEVHVLIIRVNLNPHYGLVELWVNMDDGRKDIYEKMKQEIQTPERMFDGSEGKAGEHCLVCISDTWHRARIVSVHNEAYYVFLIDQGQPHHAKCKNLAWAPAESFLLPPEIECCILSNIVFREKNPLDKAAEFLKSLPGNKYKGLVQHVLMPEDARKILLDLPTISKSLCESGFLESIQSDEFRSLVCKCVFLQGKMPEVSKVSGQAERLDQYFYPELLIDTFETVTVTWVNDPQGIFCNILLFTKALETLSKQIQQHYQEVVEEVQARTQGDPCAAKDANGRWHRSLLKQSIMNILNKDDTAEVLHVDTGKTESVPVRNIRSLHGKFLRMPVVTYFCSLSGRNGNALGWTTDQVNDLRSQVLNQILMARFDRHDVRQGIYYVTLYTADATCINNKFWEKAGQSTKDELETDVQTEANLPTFLSSFVEDQCTDLQNKPPGITHEQLSTTYNSEVGDTCDEDIFPVGCRISVNVSCFESLQRFWCQSTENGECLRLLMKDLQKYYASVHPVDSICVARNPENGMWYRARMTTSAQSTAVEVRLIDYGQKLKVPLQDVHPIDPTFLRLSGLAFPCSLFDLKNSSSSTTAIATDDAIAEFLKFVDSESKSHGLEFVVEAVTSEGLLVDFIHQETPPDNGCKLPAQQCAETRMEIPPKATSHAYNHSTHNIEVGGNEKVLVTSSESVSHFYCQLLKNSHFLDIVMKIVKELADQPQCTDHPLGLNSICLARHSDNDQWCRGKIVEISPELKVHFVDYGDIRIAEKSNIQPFPAEGGFARSFPVQAIQLGLFGVPAEVPEEVNQWFREYVQGCSFTISVLSKGEEGKLLVELLDGSLNINVQVKERISEMAQQKKTGLDTQIDQLSSQTSEKSNEPDEDCLCQDPTRVSVTQNKEENGNGMFPSDEPKENSLSLLNDFVGDTESEAGKILDVIIEENESVLTKTLIEGSDSEKSKLSPPSCYGSSTNIFMYKGNDIVQNKIELYASCIVGPNFFWCQYGNTEDLDKVTILAQEAGQAKHDTMQLDIIGPGSPCLAHFPTEDQWCRAQVIHKNENGFRVLFIDYGNESDVHITNVRPLQPNLLELAPQAILCSLSGFDESKGTWDDKVYDDFYNLLVDKNLTATVSSLESHPQMDVLLHSVQIECENVNVNEAIKKYWRTRVSENSQSPKIKQHNSLQVSHIETNTTQPKEIKGNSKTPKFKKPKISPNQAERAFASCIVDPHFFWCQYANTEDLDKLSVLAQEAGHAQQNTLFTDTFGPGSPCLAFFSTDEQWYRAQVIRKNDNSLQVVFVDYGNESDLDIKNVRPLPQILLDMAPQAFLCSLNGFDKSKGTWDDQVYDDFYNLLVDKPLNITVLNLDDRSESDVPQYSVQVDCENVVVNNTVKKYWNPVATENVKTESAQTKDSIQDIPTEPTITQPHDSAGKPSIYKYKKPKISRNQAESAYASCIVSPHFFWCQYPNTEDLDKLTLLAKESGQTQHRTMFSETLGPGSPCLALFSSDDQWYRAQVIHKNDNNLQVVFIDYGNESDVDVKNVRPLSQTLLDTAPQAFLCSLHGFDKSKGTWDEQVFDDFYDLLVDKPLRVTVINIGNNSEIDVPLYEVAVHSEGVDVSCLMEKHWKGLDPNHTCC